MIKIKSFWRNWLHNVDKLTFFALMLLIIVGFLLVLTASPAVSERINAGHFHFVYRQLIFILLAIPTIVIISSLSEKNIKRLSALGFIITICLLFLLPFFGDETKGAKRWLTILGFSIQPSEFLKPFYACIVSIILSSKFDNTIFEKRTYFRFIIVFIIHICVCALIIIQPDFGVTVTISIITIIQMFVAGLPIIWLFLSGIIFIIVCIASYIFLPHVTKRVTAFLEKDTTNSYQVQKSIESYINGGFFGKGPGEGYMKYLLPDSHTDFIFAVAGEEFGTLFCLLMVFLIAFIIIRGLLKISKLKNVFGCCLGVGVIMYLAFQSIFNIGVTLHILPTKGMTLPFISYGGSSILAFAICMGFYFNVTRLDRSINYIPKQPHLKIL